MATNDAFRCDHSDDPDFPKTLQDLHTPSPTNPHALNLFAREVNTDEQLVFLQKTIDLIRYVLTSQTTEGTWINCIND